VQAPRRQCVDIHAARRPKDGIAASPTPAADPRKSAANGRRQGSKTFATWSAGGQPHAIVGGVLCRSTSLRRRKALQEGTRKSRRRSRSRARFRSPRFTGRGVGVSCRPPSVAFFRALLRPSRPPSFCPADRLSAPSVLTRPPAHRTRGYSECSHRGRFRPPSLRPTHCPPLPPACAPDTYAPSRSCCSGANIAAFLEMCGITERAVLSAPMPPYSTRAPYAWYTRILAMSQHALSVT
jgi:hypothetical protein